MVKECNVCCEPFNKSIHKRINCNYCTYDVCTTCTQKYMLDSKQDAHCMNCKNAWNRDFMESNFTKKFYNTEYKKHRETIMFERQMSMLPETMPFIEVRRKEMKNTETLTSMRKDLNKVKTDMKTFATDVGNKYYQMVPSEKIEYQTKIGDFKKKIECLKIDIETQLTVFNIDTSRTKAATERRQFVRQCPANNCRGFLSTQWKCGLCNVKVCNKCHEIKKESGGSADATDGEHVCNEENIKSAEAIARECRQCPKANCGAMIFKIDGCDLLWCTMCHTAFSWRTGQIDESGNIHNPHYYEYLRKTNGGVAPRQPGDLLCGGLPNFYSLTNHLYPLFGIVRYSMNKNDEETKKREFLYEIETIHRMHGHINQIEMPKYVPANIIEVHRDLRIKYMLNMIDKDELKNELYRREKDRDKKTEITMVLQTYQGVVMEKLLNMMQKTSESEIRELYDEIVKLRDYINECLEKISKRYNNVVPVIMKDWRFSTTGIEKRREAAEKLKEEAKNKNKKRFDSDDSDGSEDDSEYTTEDDN